jgi:hypothetical protein
MKKVLFVGSIFITALLADNNLGTLIGGETIEKVIEKQTITTQTVEQQKPLQVPQTAPTYTQSYTKTVVPSTTRVTNTHTFKKDHHRYDKRFQNFDYDNNGYYNDDGYYYGYYDNSGYFYNNIFFTYNTLYTYDDRRYHRGRFLPRHHHYRTYRHHRVNNWNQVHCYREPNHIVYGDYYDRSYYPNHRSNHYQDYGYRDHATMTTPRRDYNQNQVERSNQNRIYNQHRTRVYNHNNHNYNSRGYSNQNHYRGSHRETYRNTHRNSGARMEIKRRGMNRNSSTHRNHSSTIPKRSNRAHIQLSR